MKIGLQEYLASLVNVDSIEALCQSISMIGPYLSLGEAVNMHGPCVSGISFAQPVSVYQLHQFTSVATRLRYYKKFTIPKKSGGTREITAPVGILKDILSALGFIFSELYVPPKNVMAFTRGRSIADNAREHCGHNYVLNLDLKDFFTSITAKDVEQGLKRIGIPPNVASEMACVCTYPQVAANRHVMNVVPQGSPASPVLSNICAMPLDQRLDGLARRFHLTYTRYADDMTFSSNHNVYHHNDDFMTELHRIIMECGFTVNPAKTRLQKRGSRQQVTGLNVCRHVNVNKKFVKNLRAAIHHIANTETLFRHDVNVVRGKLNFIRMVKGSQDSTYLKLILKLNLALQGKHFAE